MKRVLLATLCLYGCGGFSGEFRRAGQYAYQVNAGPGRQRYSEKEQFDAIQRAKAAASNATENRAAQILEHHWYAKRLSWARAAEICGAQAYLVFENLPEITTLENAISVRRHDGQCEAEFDKQNKNQ